ncbi:MAG: hypothetical protein JW934_09230 [Anaerolineae bacterium]|nr:hypothetical protein [Anaerolineae bacterium]
MWAIVAFVVGVVSAGIILAITRACEPDSDGSATQPTALGWLTLAFGVIATTAFVFGMFTKTGIGGNLVSISSASTTIIVGIGAILRHDRRWPTWVGLVAGVIPGVFWIAFAIGNMLGLGN